MTNVFQQIEQGKHNERQRLLGDYYTLLSSLDLAKPSDKEAAKLGDLMSKLGKTAEGAKKDHEAVAEVLRNVERAAARDEADVRYQTAHEAYMAVCAERQAMHIQMSEKVSAANGVAEQASAELQAATQAKGELMRLKDGNPVLYQAIVAERVDKTIKGKAR